MSIRQAVLADLSIVKNISEITISEIYPHYYPKGAVGFFLEHHREENILDDIKRIVCFFALIHCRTLSELLLLRIMKYVAFLFCLLIKVRDLVQKCLILLKE